MKTHVGMLLSLSLALVACNGGGGSNNSVDASGNCTSQFVNDYNDIVYSRYSEEEMKKACDDFLSKHTGRSCRASVGGQEKQVYASDVSTVCKANEERIAQKKNKSATKYPSYGNECSQTYINDYNTITSNGTNFRQSVSSGLTSTATYYASMLKNYCSTFFAYYSGQSCRASVSGYEKTVYTSDHTQVCKEANEFLSKPATQTGENEDFKNVYASQLQVLVLNSFNFTKAANTVNSALWNGKVVDVKAQASEISSPANKDSVTCKLIPVKDPDWDRLVLKSTRIAVDFVSVKTDVVSGNTQVILLLEGSKVGITCERLDKKPITVGQVRAAIKGTLDLSVDSRR